MISAEASASGTPTAGGAAEEVGRRAKNTTAALARGTITNKAKPRKRLPGESAGAAGGAVGGVGWTSVGGMCDGPLDVRTRKS